MPLLELRDVTARYGPIRAVHGVSLTVDDGEVVAVLGANGAGKTTTLRAISGTVRTGGQIVFNGRPIARRRPESVARRGIAHVPEGRGLFSELTVWENLRMGAYVRGDRKSLKEESERVFEYFPWMAARRDQPAATLSGGEQQMLALGRALVSRPRLLMLDEPSLGLAPTVVAEFFRIVRHLNEDRGMTVLVVEQNANIALETADRAYVLEVGRVALHGARASASRIWVTEVPLQATPAITADGCKSARGGVLSRARMQQHTSAPCVLASLAFRAPAAGERHLERH
jgi:branched-chain amino acid transport system ATP-binding protein